MEKMMQTKRFEPTMVEKEIMNLEYLKQNCSYKLSDEKFGDIYNPLRNKIGINSPAVMLLPSMAKSLGVENILGGGSENKIVIAVNKEIVPDQKYVDYLIEHECWEVYIKFKEGFNLKSADVADSKLPILDRIRPAHRYSCYREFLLASKDNKEDEYLNWWKEFYQKDRDRIDNMSETDLLELAPVYGPGSVDDLKLEVKKLIDNNQAIKEWAYNKVKSTVGKELSLSEAA